MNARQVALEVLSRVLKNKSYLNIELKRTLHDGMSAEERRFAVALAGTTIENLYRIDYVLGQFTTGKRLHTVIRNILRLGVCQLLFFESVPVSAAVNESVKLVQRNGKQQLKGFVNATLRNIADHAGNINYPDAAIDFAQYLHIMYSCPKWLCEKYIVDYGQAWTEEMLEYGGDPSKTCVRLNLNKRQEPPDGWESGEYCSDAYYITNIANIEKMPLFQQGEITVQGEASMLCVRAAGITPGNTVLDACAAPGGKSAYAAQFAGDGSVVALDIHPHRVELIENTAWRLGITNIHTQVADASVLDKDYIEQFDVVLADVPCTALGLMYRKPDIRLFKQPEDIDSIIPVQRAILQTCSNYVKSGGTLLYSTCTIDRRENEENIDWFLRNNSMFCEDDLHNFLPDNLMHRPECGRLQLFPHIDGVDGFFIARMVKA